MVPLFAALLLCEDLSVSHNPQPITPFMSSHPAHPADILVPHSLIWTTQQCLSVSPLPSFPTDCPQGAARVTLGS